MRHGTAEQYQPAVRSKSRLRSSSSSCWWYNVQEKKNYRKRSIRRLYPWKFTPFAIRVRELNLTTLIYAVVSFMNMSSTAQVWLSINLQQQSHKRALRATTA
ncbi:hypothetical protein Peur_042356 [Populus x canadensis]